MQDRPFIARLGKVLPFLAAVLVSAMAILTVNGRFAPVLGVISAPNAAVVHDNSEFLVDGALRDAIGPHQFHGFLGDSTGLYPSQFGLQGRVLAWFVGPTTDLPTFEQHARWALSILLGLVVALIIAATVRDFGVAAGVLSTVTFALSDWLLMLGPNLYWVAGTMLLPFALAWWLVDRPRWFVLPLVALAVLIRALAGYEYITCVVLAAALPAMYHGYRRRASWPRVLRSGATFAAVGSFAFLLALGIHARTLTTALGSWDLAKAKIVERAKVRSAGAGAVPSFALIRLNGSGSFARWDHLAHISRFEGTALERPIVAGMSAVTYLIRTVLTIPGVHLGLPLGVIVPLISLLWWRRWRGRVDDEDAHELRAIGLFLLGGFVASLSWAVFAFGHMVSHTHLNTIVFSVPFLPIAFGSALPLLRRAPHRVEAIDTESAGDRSPELARLVS